MKFIVAFLALLLTVSYVSAATENYPEFNLNSKVVGSWTDSATGCVYTQYDVTFCNNSNRNVKQFFIGTDATFKVRGGNAYWNVVRIHNGDLVLPAGQDVNAHATYTFGFILEGSQPANLCIEHIIF